MNNMDLILSLTDDELDALLTRLDDYRDKRERAQVEEYKRLCDQAMTCTWCGKSNLFNAKLRKRERCDECEKLRQLRLKELELNEPG